MKIEEKKWDGTNNVMFVFDDNNSISITTSSKEIAENIARGKQFINLIDDDGSPVMSIAVSKLKYVVYKKEVKQDG